MMASRTVAPVAFPIGAALTVTTFDVLSTRFVQAANNGTTAAHTSVPAIMRRMTTPSRLSGMNAGFRKNHMPPAEQESVEGVTELVR
jgi:hypothetical protein